MRIGYEGTLYYDSASNFDSPTWVPIPDVKDVTDNETMGEADASTRAGGGKEETEPALQSTSLEFAIIRKSGAAEAAGWDFLIDAFYARTEVHMMSLDGDLDTDTCRGIHGWFKVFDKSKPMPLADGIMINFVLKPCLPDDSNRLAAIEYAGGSTG